MLSAHNPIDREVLEHAKRQEGIDVSIIKVVSRSGACLYMNKVLFYLIAGIGHRRRRVELLFDTSHTDKPA